jgi:putative transposase
LTLGLDKQLPPASPDQCFVTAPREILPGQIYLVTRRCTQRQFLLTPTPRTNQIARYCLALATRQTGVVLNAVCVMSNHWHGVVSDPLARLPQFLGRFHGLLAKAQNAALGRWENLWSSEKASVVRLTTPEDVIGKMAYTIANPTSAGLVEAPEQWPGVIAWAGANQGFTARKPEGFFASVGPLPDSIRVQLVRPAILSELSDFEFSIALSGVVEELVQRARRELASRGSKFLGAAAVRRQSFDATPATLAAHRDLNPTIAARSPSARIHVLAKKDAFVRAYRRAWQRFRAGARDVKFPRGTYALRLNSAVDCDS